MTKIIICVCFYWRGWSLKRISISSYFLLHAKCLAFCYKLCTLLRATLCYFYLRVTYSPDWSIYCAFHFIFLYLSRFQLLHKLWCSLVWYCHGYFFCPCPQKKDGGGKFFIAFLWIRRIYWFHGHEDSRVSSRPKHFYQVLNQQGEFLEFGLLGQFTNRRRC
jgi:hypothetical protein